MTKSIQTVSAVTLVAVIAFAFALVSPAMAFRSFGGDRTTVDNTNQAEITNNVEVVANTGNNESEGGDGDDGGNGGSATAQDGEAYGGNGGTGGTGGVGNTILTAAALAIGTVNNDINSNLTRINDCGCDDETTTTPMLISPLFGFGQSEHLTVNNRNRTTLTNNLDVVANTGDNESEGGDGEDGGNGGSATAPDNNNFWWWLLNNDNVALGGNGGNGGNGAAGGTVTTGISQSDGLITNVINRNITRILR